jgi:hypothetical protein
VNGALAQVIADVLGTSNINLTVPRRTRRRHHAYDDPDLPDG